MTGPNYPLRLRRALKNLTPEMEDGLKKAQSTNFNASKPDFLWHSLLIGFAMQGRAAAGTKLLSDKLLYKTITYDALARLHTSVQRKKAVEIAFVLAGVRMAAKKAGFMAENFKIIQRMGGSKAASELARTQKGRDKKAKFVVQFKGVGMQLAKDIWMGVYDPDFRDIVKVNVGMKTFAAAMGVEFDFDAEYQQYFIKLAKYVGLPDAWSLDRLLSSFGPHFMAAIKGHNAAFKEKCEGPRSIDITFSHNIQTGYCWKLEGEHPDVEFISECHGRSVGQILLYSPHLNEVFKKYFGEESVPTETRELFVDEVRRYEKNHFDLPLKRDLEKAKTKKVTFTFTRLSDNLFTRRLKRKTVRGGGKISVEDWAGSITELLFEWDFLRILFRYLGTGAVGFALWSMAKENKEYRVDKMGEIAIALGLEKSR